MRAKKLVEQLNGAKRVTIEGLDGASGRVDAADGVADAHAGHGAAVALGGGQHPRKQALIGEGPRRVVDRDPLKVRILRQQDILKSLHLPTARDRPSAR